MKNLLPVATPLAVAVALALSSPVVRAAPASDTAPDSAESRANAPGELDKVTVQGVRVRKASSPKYTEELIDTPQTITVVTSETMAQQNLIGLRDVLSTLPGITFGAGEGGGGYGDSINLRGFTAGSDITTDGVRDSAQYTRTDNFNLESIELINGANSAVSGAGSVGGSINLVSKTAHAGTSHAATFGGGTDGYGRITADGNFDAGDGTAVRVNAMVHQNDVPGRDFESFERWGIAPSVAFGLGSDTRLTLAYVHQTDDNTPQYGVPFFQNAFNDGPLPGVDPSNYYGYRNVDRQQIDVDMLTGVFERDFGDAVTLRSLARYQKVDQVSAVDATQGTWCLANGINPATGAACAAPGTYIPSGPRGYVRDTSNAIAISQTDLTARFSTGAVEHALVAGIAFSKETFDLDVGSVLRNPDGSPVTAPVMRLGAPDSLWRGPLNHFLTGRTEGDLENQAVYLFDTMRFGERWLVNLGARYEHNEGSTATWNVKAWSATPGADNRDIGALLGRNAPLTNEDDLFSWRTGVVFKPADNGSIYLSYANAKTPSKASVNGACTVQTCDVDPETAANFELGTKWDLLDAHLAVTAAVFQNERENYKVADPGNPANPSGEQQLDGRARVRGVALGAAGHVNAAWSVFANYTYLDSEVLQSVSDFVRDTTGIDAQAGNPLPATPEHSGSIWTTYTLPQGWAVGYGVTWLGDYVAASTAGAPEIDGYVTHRAMVGYQIDERWSLQLNVNNLFDKTYYTRVRNNGWATPGDARSAVLTAQLAF